jgi:hypothetical protein
VPAEIRIYYEGDTLLKRGFHEFFTELRNRAKERHCEFRLVAGGSGSNARGDFPRARKANPKAWNILLIDSEGPDTGNLSVSLCREQRWNSSQANSIFWMIKMMESWFHADKDALERFYGLHFNRKALKANPRVKRDS